jgi:hydrogenase assembly chaperone HypC/HupF
MCLGIPLRIIEINEEIGIGEIGGVEREVNLRFIEDIKVGDYVISHAGFAIQKLDEKEANETLALLRGEIET